MIPRIIMESAEAAWKIAKNYESSMNEFMKYGEGSIKPLAIKQTSLDTGETYKRLRYWSGRSDEVKTITMDGFSQFSNPLNKIPSSGFEDFPNLVIPEDVYENFGVQTSHKVNNHIKCFFEFDRLLKEQIRKGGRNPDLDCVIGAYGVYEKWKPELVGCVELVRKTYKPENIYSLLGLK